MARRSTRFCPNCRSRVEIEAANCARCSRATPTDGWPRTRRDRFPLLGERFEDRLLFEQQLGYGSTGEVYRALNVRIGRDFAAKVIDRRTLPPGLSVEAMTERVRREVKALGSIRSPHVVQMIDLLTPTPELTVLVMELAEGITLDEYLEEEGQVPLSEALEITWQILEALDELHARGVVHRDLKPENIMVEMRGTGRPFIRLLDFGIAKIQDAPDMTAAFVGTPHFCAPEQIEDAKKVDHRTDLYATACIFFAMLAGRPPFVGESITHVITGHLTLPVPDVPESVATEVRPLVQAFVDKAMAKEPAERFRSSREMARHPIFQRALRAATIREEEVTSNLEAVSDDAGAGEDVAEEESASKPANRTWVIPGGASDVEAASAGSDDLATRPRGAVSVDLALSADGEAAVLLRGDGSISLFQAPFDQPVATTVFPTSAEAFRVLWTRGDAYVCVVGTGGRVSLRDPETLRPIASRTVEIEGGVVWAGMSRTHDDAVLLATPDEMIRVFGRSERVERVGVGVGRCAVTAAGPSRDDTTMLYLSEASGRLAVRESAEGVTTETLPERASIRDGFICDARSPESLLSIRGGRLFVMKGGHGELEEISPAWSRDWVDARWFRGTTSVIGVTGDGDVMEVERDGSHRRFGEGALLLDVGLDADTAVFVDAEGHLQGVGPDRFLSAESSWSTLYDSREIAVLREAWDVAPQSERLVHVVALPDHVVVYLGATESPQEFRVEDCVGVRDVRFNEEETYFALTDESGAVIVFDQQGGLQLRLEDVEHPARKSAPLGGGDAVCVADSEERLVYYTIDRDVASRRWVVELRARVTSLQGSARSGRIVAATEDGGIHILNAEFGQRSLSLGGDGDAVRDVAFSPDGHIFAVLRSSGAVEVFEAHAGQRAYRQQLRQRKVRRIAWEDGGELVGFGRNGRQVQRYPVAGRLRT